MQRKKIKIPMTRMAQYRHVKFLISLEKQSVIAYNYVSLKLLKEIKQLLRKEKLAKSDDDKLHANWSAEVPTIEVDFEELLSPVIDKYLEAIRWALLGNYAGKGAAVAAEEVGLKDKITPGIIPSAYLQSIDSHRIHYIDLFAKPAPEMPKEIVKESLSNIIKRADRFIDQMLLEYKNKIITTVEGSANEITFDNYNKALNEAQNLAPEKGSEEAVQSATEGLDTQIGRKELSKELDKTIESYESRFETVARSQAAQASAVATHQSMLEIYGPENDDLRVVNMEMKDERVCTFCHKVSKNADGTWTLYKLTDLQASGYNFSRKRDEWKLSIAPQHHRCRCQTVYVPPGFKVDKNGTIVPKK